MITIGMLVIVGFAAGLVLAINRVGGSSDGDAYAPALAEDPPPQERPAARRASVVALSREMITLPPTEMEARGPPT